MPLSTVSPDLASSPSRSTAVLLGIAALGAAVGSLGCYVFLLDKPVWSLTGLLPTKQVAVFYLPLAGLVGWAWISANLRMAALLGALAGAWLGLALGLAVLSAVGSAGPISAPGILLVLIITTALGAGFGSTMITTITWALRAFTRWLDSRAAHPVPGLWKGAIALYVLCIPSVLWALQLEPFMPSIGLLLLAGGGVFGWVLWEGVQRRWRWQAAAPLVALVLLIVWYVLVKLSHVVIPDQMFQAWMYPSWYQANGEVLEVSIAEILRLRYAPELFQELPLVIGLHTGPLAALVWGWLAWAGYARAHPSVA